MVRDGSRLPRPHWVGTGADRRQALIEAAGVEVGIRPAVHRRSQRVASEELAAAPPDRADIAPELRDDGRREIARSQRYGGDLIDSDSAYIHRPAPDASPSSSQAFVKRLA